LPPTSAAAAPADPVWIEFLVGHLKVEQPHFELIEDFDVHRGELAHRRHHDNTVRLQAGIGDVTLNQEHRGEDDASRAARRDGLTQARSARTAYQISSQEQRCPDDQDLHVT
jgi:putative transposase